MEEQEEKKRLISSLVVPTCILVVMWTVMLTEKVFHIDLGGWGVTPHTAKGLVGILTMPFLHGNWEHLLSNSAPLAILGIALYYFYRQIASKILFITYLSTGILTWFIAENGTHIGASALIYGLNFFLIFSGFIRRNLKLIALSLIVIFLYGSFVWGLIPSLMIPQHVSWEGHLSGALVGLALAYYFRKQGPQREPETDDKEEEENDDDLDDNGKPYWDVPEPDRKDLTVVYRFKKKDKGTTSSQHARKGLALCISTPYFYILGIPYPQPFDHKLPKNTTFAALTRFNMTRKIFFIILSISLLASCESKKPKENNKANSTQVTINQNIPNFNADSAFRFVACQTDFGPRVPGTEAHEKCALWLEKTLSSFADTVIVQSFRARLYNKNTMNGKNLIASFHPEATQRIVLCAHWDSRPFADHDTDDANWDKPIDGANDGASGVGVLLETARLPKQHPTNEELGLDIVLFDLEDYGPPQSQAMEYYDENNYWALGSQYWSSNPHKTGYHANFGILLDMVGGNNPNFMKEYYSQSYASWVSNKVWRKAHELGYQHCFSNELGDPISDDHIPMNTISGIPTIDIIDLQPNSANQSFPNEWHTLNDNIDAIDKQTLGMVGTLIINIIFDEAKEK